MNLIERFANHQDYHQSPAYAAAMRTIGWESHQCGEANVFLRRLGPVSFAKLQRGRGIDWKKLAALRRQYHALQFFIDPALAEGESPPLSAGFKVTRDHHAHTKTLIVDLAGSERQILSSFSQSARRQISQGQKSSVIYRAVPFAQLTNTEISEALELHALWSKEKKVYGYPDSFLKSTLAAFSQSGTLLTARENGKLIGVIYHLEYDQVGLYFYAYTSPRGRQLHVPYVLAWESIKLAKTHGCDVYDFCSCYDERYPKDNPRWQGFTEFKQRFHPTPIYYPEAQVAYLW